MTGKDYDRAQVNVDRLTYHVYYTLFLSAVYGKGSTELSEIRNRRAHLIEQDVTGDAATVLISSDDEAIERGVRAVLDSPTISREVGEHMLRQIGWQG